jgi:hypothetical protein
MKMLVFLLLVNLWFCEWTEPWGKMKMFVEVTDTLSTSSINQDSVRMYLDDGFHMISVVSTTMDTTIWRNPAITVPEVLLSTGLGIDSNLVYDSLLHIIVLNKFIPMNIKMEK